MKSNVIVVSIFITLCLLSSTISYVTAQEALSLTISCADNTQYFNPTTLACQSCQISNMEIDAPNFSCKCTAGYIKDFDSTSMSCTDCVGTLNRASSQDRTRCIACGATTNGLDATTRECLCNNANEILVEKDWDGNYLSEKACVACPGTTTRETLYKCAACTAATCTCPTGFTLDPNTEECLETSIYSEISTQYPTSSLNAAYSNLEGANTLGDGPSAYLQKYFHYNAVKCKESANLGIIDSKNCNALANMCVISLYASDSAACRVYLEITSEIAGGVNGWEGWKAKYPFVYHGASPPIASNTITTLKNLDMTVSFGPVGDALYRMKLYASRYTLNGTWLGFKEISNDFQLCGGSQLKTSTYLNYGQNVATSCQLNVRSLFQEAEPIFFDLFIVYGNPLKAYPVPVQILERTDGYIDPSNTALYRRFFLYDNIMSKTDLAHKVPTFVTFLHSSSLRFTQYEDEKIYPPILTLRYTGRTSSNLFETSDSYITYNLTTSDTDTNYLTAPYIYFDTVYAMNSLQTFNLVIMVLVIVGWIFGVIFAVFQTCCFVRKRESAQLDREIIITFLTRILTNLANVSFFILFGGSIYVYWFYKYQNNAYLVLPRELDMLGYYILLGIAVFAKLIDMIIITYHHTHFEICLMDWEREKILEGDTHVQPSAWRAIQVIKQLYSLSIKRGVNLEFTMIMVLIFLEAVPFYYLSTEQPNYFNLNRDDLSHPILRFCIVSMIWGGIVIILYILRLLQFRFVLDNVNTLVDTCSVSNISVFMLTEQVYGYYLHGESVHDSADIDMKDFDRNFNRESDGTALERGLIPDKLVMKRNQSFEMIITQRFRQEYNEILPIPIQNEITKNNMSVPKDGVTTNTLGFQNQANVNFTINQQQFGRFVQQNNQPLQQNTMNPQLANQQNANNQFYNQQQGQQNMNIQQTNPQIQQQSMNQQQPINNQQPMNQQPMNQQPMNQQQGQQQQQQPMNQQQSLNNQQQPQMNQQGQQQMNQQQQQMNQQQRMNQQGIQLQSWDFRESTVYKFINPNRAMIPSRNLYRQQEKLNMRLRQIIAEIRSDYLRRILPKTIAYRLGIPPHMSMIRKNILVNDPQKSFTAIFLRGLEMKALILNILLFAAFDLMQNPFVSMGLVWIVNWSILQIRKFWMKSNLVGKTLIDGRFIG